MNYSAPRNRASSAFERGPRGGTTQLPAPRRSVVVQTRAGERPAGALALSGKLEERKSPDDSPGLRRTGRERALRARPVGAHDKHADRDEVPDAVGRAGLGVGTAAPPLVAPVLLGRGPRSRHSRPKVRREQGGTSAHRSRPSGEFDWPRWAGRPTTLSCRRANVPQPIAQARLSS
jgi:hypothetical protein